MRAIFASDLHGDRGRYLRLFDAARRERPDAVLLGGDLTPHGLGFADPSGDFLEGFLWPALEALRGMTRVLAILGNDDPAALEPEFRAAEADGLLEYVHGRRVEVAGVPVFGYAFVPPTPFPLKDWERYDVSRFVDAGCVSPEDGIRSIEVPPQTIRHATIAADLAALAGTGDLAASVWLFHAPPYRSALDRAALDGRSIDHVPLDVHVGSIAIRRFLEARGPAVALHGHVHESVRLTGAWRDQVGRTACFGAAHDGPELALVRFDTERLADASRAVIS